MRNSGGVGPQAAISHDRGMSGQTIALVTGATKGIGYEFAAGLGGTSTPKRAALAVRPGDGVVAW